MMAITTFHYNPRFKGEQALSFYPPTAIMSLKRGIKKTPEIYPLDKEKNQIFYSFIHEARPFSRRDDGRVSFYMSPPRIISLVDLSDPNPYFPHW